MSELRLKEAINYLQQFQNGTWDLSKNKEIKQSLSLVISKLQLLEQVEKGGVKKLDIREEEKEGLSFEYKLGYSEAIDLCNAHLVKKLTDLESVIAEFIPHRDSEYIESLAKAIREMLEKL